MSPSKLLAVQKFLSLRDIHNQTGVPLETLKSLVKRERFPKHDAEIGEGGHQLTAVGWKQATVDTWWNGYRQ